VRKGMDVTLFATQDSQTMAKLIGVCPRGYEEDKAIEPKVWECLHIAELFERGDKYDLIHNHFDFLPLTYSHMTVKPAFWRPILRKWLRCPIEIFVIVVLFLPTVCILHHCRYG